MTNTEIGYGFIDALTVDKKIIIDSNKEQLDRIQRFGKIGPGLTNDLLIKFASLEEVGVRWACEGYDNAPRFNMRFPHIAFMATPKGLNTLMCYLEECKQQYKIGGENWIVTFSNTGVKTILPTIKWSYSRYVKHSEKVKLFTILEQQFEQYF